MPASYTEVTSNIFFTLMALQDISTHSVIKIDLKFHAIMVCGEKMWCVVAKLKHQLLSLTYSYICLAIRK